VKNLIKQLKRQNGDLKEAEIEGILYLIKNDFDLTNSKLVRLTGIPKETLRRFNRSFTQYFREPEGNKVVLNEDGRRLLESADLRPYKWSLLEYYDDALESRLSDIRQKYDLKAKREYDQFFADSKTSISKAKILVDKGLVAGKSIALIGDDDLVTIAISLIEPGFNQVAVFDIDEKVLGVIRAISDDLGIKNVHTLPYDVRNEPDARSLGVYDAVLVDPPYTKNGVSLFVNRSIQLLKKPDSAGKYIFLYYGNSFKSPEKFIDIQEIVQQYNLVIEDKIDKFGRYFGAESIGSASSLYVLKATRKTRAFDNYSIGGIYTFDAIRDGKFPYVEHYTFKLFGISSVILRSEKKLIGLAKDLCKIHNLKIEDIIVTRFKPGYSVALILRNSNLVLHTWEEYEALHIDLITCEPVFKSEDLFNTVKSLFKTELVEMKQIE